MSSPDIDSRVYKHCRYCYHHISRAVDGVCLYYCDISKEVFVKSNHYCQNYISIYLKDDVYDHAGQLFDKNPFPNHLQLELPL